MKIKNMIIKQLFKNHLIYFYSNYSQMSHKIFLVDLYETGANQDLHITFS